MPTIEPAKSNLGTHFQSIVFIDYADLVTLFGEPNWQASDDGKVKVEWCLEIDGVRVTIYDWKNPHPAKRIRNWHIGGSSSKAVDKFFAVVDAYDEEHEEGISAFTD